MSVRFILGSSGSGKSEYLYKKVTEEAALHPDRNYLVIVPEQFTLATQQTLVALSPNKAIMNVDVLSFKRLAYRVFDDLGMNDISVLEETGKNLILRRIAQENDEELTVLKHNMSRMGYVDEMKSLLSEFMQYNVRPEDLHRAIESNSLSKSFSAKLKDVALLYEKFDAYRRDHFITAEEILNVLKSVAKDSALLRDSFLAFDEYTGFTPIQYDLLEELLPIASEIDIALTMDMSLEDNTAFLKLPAEEEKKYLNSCEHDLFHMSKTTIRHMKELCQKTGASFEEAVCLYEAGTKRFTGANDLSHLEAYLFRQKMEEFPEEPEHIKLSSSANPREELIHAAGQINRLIRQGYRYKEIAVISGNVEGYGNYAEEIFSKYKIPCFIDTTSKISFSPFIEFLRAALAVISEDYSYEAVLRFVRCGFLDIEESKLDLLDNYLLATGIRGRKTWESTWLGKKGKSKRKADLFDLAEMEGLRLSVKETLKPLETAFDDPNATISDGIKALYRMLLPLNAEGKLWQAEEDFLAKGLQKKAKEYGQVYGKVMDLLDKYNELLGEEKLSVDSFSELMEAGLSAIQVGAIPPGYDSVVVGDVERTRLNGIKVLFFLGVNEGIIPKSGNGGGIISEFEREALTRAQSIELAPGLREKAFIQRFYLYRNLTKPSDLLYLSYSRSGSDGKALEPSYLIAVVKILFPKLSECMISNPQAKPDASSEDVLLDYLVAGEHDANWYAGARLLKDQELAMDVLAAPYAHYQADPISRNVARHLYGDSLYGSITRLESYAKCAYSHFLSYGLKLSEREEAGLDSMDVGNLYHEALEDFSGQVKASGKDWFTLSETDRIAFSNQAMDNALINHFHSQILTSKADAHQLDRMKDIFVRNTWALVTQIKQGNFVPEDFELKFSDQEEQTLKYSLKDGRFLNLNGKIDRLDALHKDGNIYIKIVDYKTGSEKFDLNRIYHGLQLQLAVYLNAAMALKGQELTGGQVLPAGILYQKIGDAVLTPGTSDPEQAFLKDRRPDGLINSDQELYLEMDQELENGVTSSVIPVGLKKGGDLAQSSSVASGQQLQDISEYATYRMQDFADAIYAGEVAVSPYRLADKTACDYCSFKGICGFENRMEGYAYRNLKKYENADLFERIETELAQMKYERKESL